MDLIDALNQELRFEPLTAPTQDNRCSWTEKSTARLVELHSDNYSCSQMARIINDEFGTSFTRNAIAGKCFRLDLPGRKRNLPPASRVPRSRGLRRHPFRPRKRPAYVDRFDVIEPEFVCDPIPLLDLEPHSCRWAVSPDFASPIMFCGAMRLDPFSYCARHCRMAFNAPALRTAAEYELVGRKMRRARKQKGLSAA